MVEIIQAGDTDLIWPRTFSCPHCESLLKVKLEDIKRHTLYNGQFMSWFIDCPACFEQPDVPYEWYSTVERLKRELANFPPQPPKKR